MTTKNQVMSQPYLTELTELTELISSSGYVRLLPIIGLSFWFKIKPNFISFKIVLALFPVKDWSTANMACKPWNINRVDMTFVQYNWQLIWSTARHTSACLNVASATSDSTTSAHLPLLIDSTEVER
jgi:hypothetical protein